MCPDSVKTYSRTSLLNCSLLLPKNSPIICLLRPFLCSRKCATPMAVSGTKPRVIRKWMPRSGFLPVDDTHRVSHRCRELSSGYNLSVHQTVKVCVAGVREQINMYECACVCPCLCKRVCVCVCGRANEGNVHSYVNRISSSDLLMHTSTFISLCVCNNCEPSTGSIYRD